MFKNRGNIPNFNISGFRYHHHYWGRTRYIIYDKTFIAIELIFSFIILVTCFAAWLYSYKIPFEDPIATIKNNFLTSQFLAIAVPLCLVLLVTFLSPNKKFLINFFKMIATISLLILLILLCIKIHMDITYNRETFGSFYEQYKNSLSTEPSFNINTFLVSGLNLSNPKQFYIDECITAYFNFSVKTLLCIILQLANIILIFYLSHRLSSVEVKKNKLAKDDEILYDEEQNVKF